MMWPMLGSIAFGLISLAVVAAISWFVWSRKRIAPPTRQSAVVNFDDDSVTCRRGSGLVETVRWSDLRAIVIQTTADGPVVDDVFWVLVGQTTGCVVPSESTGMDGLLERLQALPGFDNEAVMAAMACTDERKFICWERGGRRSPGGTAQ
jgi:hypothetical protein